MRVVHPYAIAGFLSALAAAHATVVVCVAALTVLGTRRSGSTRITTAPPERTLPAFGLLNLAVVAIDGGLATAYARAVEGPPALAVPLGVAEAGRVFAVAFLVHFVLLYARLPRGPVVLAGIYSAAGFLSVASLTHRQDALAAATIEGTNVAGMWFPCVRAPASLLGTIPAVAIAVGAVGACVVLAGALARGRREAIAVVGAVVLAGSCAFDGARQAGLVLGPPVEPFAYAFLVNGLIVTLLARFTELRGQLEHRAKELKDRARDLTRAYADLRAAQDELVRKEQLTAVGELSAVVAHEVRNPLAIISNAVATLRREGVEDADRRTLLGILDEETSRLNRLVGDLLRYTRPINPERQLVSVRDLVTRGMALAQGKIGLDVEVVEPEPTQKIWGDPNLLRQVFDNLINNAIQAMSSGGVLTVTLTHQTQEGAFGVEAQIQDTGDGMDTEVRARALDPFFTTRPSGTGLGLAIVARIVDAHGGTLRIKSKAGAGTAMHVFLPQGTEPGPRSRDGHRGSVDRVSDPLLPPELARSLRSGR